MTKRFYYTLVQDDVREGLEWLHELYSEGLVDPEIFSQDGASYSAKGLLPEELVVFLMTGQSE